LAYLAIIVCFITENWEMASVLFDFPHLEGQHTGKNMAEIVTKKIVEMGLADNASTIFLRKVSSLILAYRLVRSPQE
jgi:hypothetical protein